MGNVNEIRFFEENIKTDTSTNPKFLYGISKNVLHQSIELLVRDIYVIFQWIRGFYIVGNTAYGCSIFSKIAKVVQEKQKKFSFTTGEKQFDFIDYDKFCMM